MTCSSASWSSYWRWMKDIIATSTGMSTSTSHAPSQNFTAVTMTATIPVSAAPKALMASRRR